MRSEVIRNALDLHASSTFHININRQAIELV